MSLLHYLHCLVLTFAWTVYLVMPGASGKPRLYSCRSPVGRWMWPRSRRATLLYALLEIVMPCFNSFIRKPNDEFLLFTNCGEVGRRTVASAPRKNINPSYTSRQDFFSSLTVLLLVLLQKCSPSGAQGFFVWRKPWCTYTNELGSYS